MLTLNQPLQPPPPEWLNEALKELQANYPYDSFEAFMRYFPVNPQTNTPIAMQPGQQPPPDATFTFLPRIRCRDCPGKLYTPGTDGTASNFEIHLKNKMHREKVNARCGIETRPAHQK